MGQAFQVFLAALFTNLWLYGTGLGPVAMDALAQVFIRPYREWAEQHGPFRRRFIALVAVCGFLWASFAAFKEQYEATQRAEHATAEKEAARRTAQGLADDRLQQINRDTTQIRDLQDKLTRAENKPPKTLIQHVPAVQSPQKTEPLKRLASYPSLRLIIEPFGDGNARPIGLLEYEISVGNPTNFPAHWDPKLRIPRGQVVAAASIVSPKY